jgi:phage terminase large subunit-like protein
MTKQLTAKEMSALGLQARIKKAGGQEKFAEYMRKIGSRGGKSKKTIDKTDNVLNDKI